MYDDEVQEEKARKRGIYGFSNSALKDKMCTPRMAFRTNIQRKSRFTPKT